MSSFYYGPDQTWDAVRLTLVEKRRWLANASDDDLIHQFKSAVLAQDEEKRKRGGFLELKDDVELATSQLLHRMKSKRQ